MFFSLKTTKIIKLLNIKNNNYFKLFLFILLIYSSNGYKDESYLKKRLILINGRDEGQQQQQQISSPQIQNYYKSRSPFYGDAYRLHCHSCMSPYLEDQFQFISHLYRRPLGFTEKCDHGHFDSEYVHSKNCTDACITLRMNDRVGGRRRFGFMRGCLSDIIHHNRTAVRFGELSRTTKTGANICTAIRLRDLFVSSDRYGFDPHDHVDLCACIRTDCNSVQKRGNINILLFIGLLICSLISLLPKRIILINNQINIKNNKNNKNNEEEELNKIKIIKIKNLIKKYINVKQRGRRKEENIIIKK
ncbi:hypothetical protein ACQ4LE_007388 [Meloidogyne hapla]|uniref:Caenorhabditis elegans ly-6-related family-containing protein n=1 Tax=Meloidogyne hapla TaxID=6305 RepID=A0A1I8B7V4_MELHA